MNIHRVTPSDFDIYQINWLRAQQTPGAPPKLIEGADLREMLSNPHFYLYIARQDQRYVGMAAIFIQRIFSGWIAEIHDVVVDESARGMGIGEKLTRQLMQVALDFCRERSANMKLSLTCRPSRKAANELYKKLGFVMIAQSTGPKGTNLYEITVGPDGFKGR